MTVSAAAAIPVDLRGGCNDPGCVALIRDLYNQLDVPNYTIGVALMEVPASLEEWRNVHRTARKRADRSIRLGYRFAEIDRSQYDDHIYEINTSLKVRQRRPMSEGYRKRNSPGPLPDYPCIRHNVRMYGVISDAGRLAAYLIVYRLQELCLISTILGHGDRLGDDIMYLLFAGLVANQAPLGGWFYYSRWQDGTDGLRYYKARLGFQETDIRWIV